MPIKLYKIGIKESISKDETLEEVKCLITVEELGISYDKYVEPALLWTTGDTEVVAKALDVNRVIPEGAYISGLFGGEKKKGKQEYAGLVVESHKELNGIAYIKLVNLSKAYQVPIELMKQYRVSIFKVYYRGLVNPFKCETYSVLLSNGGRDSLKGFLKKMIEVNRGAMTLEDIRRLETLIKEVKTSIDLFKPRSYYVIYRRNRAFTACVPGDLSSATSSHNISYIECKSLEQAYYYTAVLNYLAFKVVELGRSFIRDQFARPVIAVVVAGLSWRDVPEKVRKEVSTLSKQLSEKLGWKEYSNQKVALKDVVQTPEFKRIISVLDGYVDREKLNSALELVSATGATEEESEETEE